MLFPVHLVPVVLLTACAARAGTAPPPRAAAEWEEPALEPAEGSLWDAIEDAMDGQPPPVEVVEASGELAEERSAEVWFLDSEEGRASLDALAWYRDPLGFLTADPLYLDRIDPGEFDLPLVVNDDVQRWMRYFLGRGRKYYARWLARSTRYRPMISEALRDRGMPQDLFYLAMIESGFSPHAYSTAHAAGLWQFIPTTGTAYGLRVDWWIDERRDPARATEAAVSHLQDLHEMFGDWYIAAAAYNAGAGRLRRAIAQTGRSDYWTLAVPGVLADETCNYVPKLIAAAIIGKHPERYGFTDIPYEAPLALETVPVPASTSVEAMARCAGVATDDFEAMNPALRRWALPPDPDTWPVRVKAGSAESFAGCVGRIPPSERLAFRRHRVARGESLGGIARKYGVSVEAIAQINDIRNTNRIMVGSELVIPVAGAPATAAVPAEARTRTERSTTRSSGSGEAGSGTVTWHTIRRGETLAGIAARHDVSVQDLMSWNGLADADRIQAGQKLRVQGGSAGGGTTGGTATTYTVQQGDTLSQIAERFGVSTADLQSWNGISDASRIQPGQVLTIRSAETSWTTYTVRSGDTLGAIARRHDCSVDDLMAWNSLSSSTIRPGQKLRIMKR